MKKIIFWALISLFPLFFACSSDNDEEKPEDINIELNVGDSYMIETSNTVLESLNDFVFFFDENKITAKHVGDHETKAISNEGEFNIKISVLPNYTLYPDLKVFLGMPKSAIEAAYGQATSVNAKGLHTYKQLYIFEEYTEVSYENDKVQIIAITYKYSYYKDVINHLKDRYKLYTSDSNSALLGDASKLEDAKTVIILQWNSKYIMVGYSTPEYILGSI